MFCKIITAEETDTLEDKIRNFLDENSDHIKIKIISNLAFGRKIIVFIYYKLKNKL